MGLDSVERIFNNLDDWRKLPAYQLERRADIYFATYLPEVLKSLKIINNVKDMVIIPEFPLSKKALRGNYIYRDSLKIDYLVLNKENKKAIFVELKTDMISFDPEQYQNMQNATIIGLDKFCQMIIELLPKQNFRKRVKYYNLLKKLSDAGLVLIPKSVKDIMNGRDHRGITKIAKEIMVLENAQKFQLPHNILYILPNQIPEPLDSDQQITFKDFATGISTKDELSLRFIKSLNKWQDR